jgi:ATP-binding cassette subfamily B (MDR/TAP) protein 1
MASPPSYTARPSEDVVVSEDEENIQNKSQILSQQVDSADVHIGFFSLYRYATLSDKLLLLLSVACCVIAGAAVPGMTVSQPPPAMKINPKRYYRSFSVV